MSAIQKPLVKNMKHISREEKLDTYLAGERVVPFPLKLNHQIPDVLTHVTSPNGENSTPQLF